MFKKVLLAFVAVALLLAAVGCQCNPAAVPSPSPSASASMMPTTEPTVSSAPTLSASPGTGGENGAGGAAATIPDFKEGTEVKEDKVPEIAKAIKDEYKDAKIVSIKHAMQEDLQVYAVEIDNGGKTETVYVQPDGTILEEGTGGTGTGTGGTGGTGTGSTGGT